jgi:RNA polymerase sigma-70 factor (ECF subfamily)
LSEQEIVEQLRHGDEEAFKKLVTHFQQKVFNTALNFLQNQHDAEDIAQEVFIQVYHSIRQFKENASLSTWIYRITITKCLDHLRNKKRKKRFAFISSLFSEKNVLLYDAPDFNHPGVQLDRKEDASMLFKLVNTLPASQKTAFLLNKIDALSYNEIAAILKISESAVDSLLQRAKQNLRKKLNNQIISPSGEGFKKK